MKAKGRRCAGPAFYRENARAFLGNIFIRRAGRLCLALTVSSWLLLGWICAGAVEGALLRENVELVKQIGGSALSVALQGNLAYLGLGPTLHILDVKKPESPELKGKILLPGLVKGIAVSGRYAYVADGKGGLRIIDVVIPSAPREVGYVETEDFAIKIKDPVDEHEILILPGIEEAVGVYVSVQDDRTYAYVAAGKGGVRVIDVSTPSAPQKFASYLPAEELAEVKGVYISVQGDKTYAYVAAGKEGLWVLRLDLSDPKKPKLTRSAKLAIEGEAMGVYVSGDSIYVAAGEGGLTVARAEKDGSGAISSLQEMGRYQADGRASGVVVSGLYAYVAYGKRGLRVINVESPSFLWEVGTYRSIAEAQNEAMLTFAHGIAVAGSYAYLANGRLGLEVVALLNPAAPKKVASYHDTVGFISAFFALGQDVCTAAGPYGFNVLKMTDPLSIQEIDLSEGVSLYYLVDSEFADQMPLTQGAIFISGGYPRIGDTGGHLFRIYGKFGLRVGDIKPDFTGTAGSYPPPSPQPDEVVRYASGVFVVNTTAYLADRDAGLIILDASNPIPHAHPNPVKRISQLVKPDVDWGAAGVFVAARGANTYAYVAAGEAGLRIVDVTDPTDLSTDKVIGALPVPAPAVAVFVSGNHAYVAAGDLLVVDVSDPTRPQQRGRFDVPGQATWVQVAGGLAYVVDQAGSLLVVDVSDPDHPTEVGHFDTPGQISGVFVSSGYAYVSDGDGGLLILRHLPPAPAGPILALDPSNLWFGEVILNTARELTFTLKNPGTEELHISNLLIGGGAFSLVEVLSVPFSLAPGASQAIQVRFSPTSVGLQSGSVTVISDDPQQGVLSVALAGRGIKATDIRLGNEALVQLAINGGAESTTKRKVTLNISAPKEVTRMRFSNDGSQWSSWKRASRVQPWSLTKGEGVKQVWGEFKTEKGKVMSASDTIILKGKGR